MCVYYGYVLMIYLVYVVVFVSSTRRDDLLSKWPTKIWSGQAQHKLGWTICKLIII